MVDKLVLAQQGAVPADASRNAPFWSATVTASAPLVSAWATGASFAWTI